MSKKVIYIHGQGGTPAEAGHYKSLFPDSDVFGFDYKSQSPWEAQEEFPRLFDSLCDENDSVTIIANSIGAFFTIHALSERKIEKAFFISPVVDMENLIIAMMNQAGVSETELSQKGTIETPFGQTLSWEYLSFVRNNPIHRKIPTHILYGENDNLTSLEAITEFTEKTGATLCVMKNGEHWFHTEEQMAFLDEWIEAFK